MTGTRITGSRKPLFLINLQNLPGGSAVRTDRLQLGPPRVRTADDRVQDL